MTYVRNAGRWAGAFALALGACTALAQPASAQIEIQWWHAMTGANNAVIEKLAADFNAAQKDYKVVPTFKGNYADTLNAGIAAFRAGNAPHIMQVFEVGTATMMAAKGAIKPVQEMMKEAGWTEEAESFKVTGTGWVIDRNRERIDVPAGYGMAVRNVVQEVQAHIQELLLGDLLSSKDEVTPPQYSELVERYYEVLARQKRPESK